MWVTSLSLSLSSLSLSLLSLSSLSPLSLSLRVCGVCGTRWADVMAWFEDEPHKFSYRAFFMMLRRMGYKPLNKVWLRQPKL
jgi:hypothetical protein